jgi:hypothetical protein
MTVIVAARDLLPGDYLVHQHGTVHGCVPSAGPRRQALAVLTDNRVVEFPRPTVEQIEGGVTARDVGVIASLEYMARLGHRSRSIC